MPDSCAPPEESDPGDEDALWQHWSQIAGHPRPDYRHDPAMAASGLFLGDGSVPRNLYAWIAGQVPDLPELLAALRLNAGASPLPDPLPDELFFELIALGEPADRQISGFSASLYFCQHHDIARSGMAAIVHYLRWGHREPMRQLPASLRRRSHLLRPDDTGPVLLISTGAGADQVPESLVRDLAREARLLGMVPVLHTSAGALPGIVQSGNDDLAAILADELPLWQLRLLQGQLPQEVVAAVMISTGSPSLTQECLSSGVPIFGALPARPQDGERRRYERLLLCHAQELICPQPALARSWEAYGATLGLLSDNIRSMPATSFPAAPPDTPEDPEAAAQSEAEARRLLAARFGADWQQRPLVLTSGPQAVGTIFGVLAQTLQTEGAAAGFLWIAPPDETPTIPGRDRDMGCPQAPGTSEMHIWQTPSLLPALARLCSHYIVLGGSSADETALWHAMRAGARVALCGDLSGRDLPLHGAEPGMSLRHFPLLDIFGLRDFILAPARPPRRPEPQLHPETQPGQSLASAILAAVQAQTGHNGGPVSISRLDPVIGGETAPPVQRRSSWLSAGECAGVIAQSDHWLHRQLRVVPSPAARILRGEERFVLHHHIFDPSGLSQTLERHGDSYRRAERVVFTVPSEAVAARVAQCLSAAALEAEVIRLPNRGRDVLPFLRHFRDDFTREPTLWWCHVHQKHSPHLKRGRAWRDHLFATLLDPSPDDLPATDATAPAARLDDPGLGLIAPLCDVAKTWGPSARWLPVVAPGFRQPLPQAPLLFPAGNMFFCRGGVASAMLDIFGPDYPWPDEPTPLDGSEYHLIERLWPAVAAQSGYRSAFLGFYSLD